MTTKGYTDAPEDDSLFVYPGLPDGTLGSPTHVPTGGGISSHMGIALADVDQDGDLDAAVSTYAGVQIYRQTSTGLVHAWTVPVGEGDDVRLSDLNGDGLADLVIDAYDGIHVWWQVNGDFVPAPTGERLSTTQHHEVEVGDVNGDGLPDLVGTTNMGVEVFLQNPDHSFAAPAAYTSGGPDPWTMVNGLAVADINGDGRADVHLSVGGNKPNSWVITRYAQANGTLGSPVARASYDIPEALEAGDVTGDGIADLVVVHSGWNALGVYDSTPGTNPTETFYKYDSRNWGPPQRLALGDVTGDGRLDVVGADDIDGLVLMRSVAPGADITPPRTTITSAPPQVMRARGASFSFTANEPATFSCSMDAGTWTPCTSPTPYDGLTSGGHRFQVRATDLAGNVETVPAAYSFTVYGPDTTITSGPTGTVRSTSATLAFTAAANAATFECALDNDPFTACTSPVTYTGLTTGTVHGVRVRAVGADGLVDSTPALRTWTVDAAADLATTLAVAPSPGKKNTTLTWTGTVTDTGPQSASGVTWTQTLPSGFTFGSVTAVPSASTSAAGSCAASGSPATVRCALGSMAPGLRWTITVAGTVTVPKGTLTSTAVAATTAWDRAPGNDSVSTSVTVGNGR